ncbi:hypothetical protein J6TS7_29560 [Paenibacillus dendritiformis]|uniref:hypothetical protein n=1 Tax=Paenibacillus TaxID=44249 RepID=UPI001B1BD600|nr:hypothetical protein [Paenibacillus dendritiformis]GIO79346.1 hypothetical protein J6TS7_29560 [Paenibacillus dendritiformis]
MDFPSREEFESLTRDMKIAVIKELRKDNTIQDMANKFKMKNNSQYYDWLKKLGIHEEVKRPNLNRDVHNKAASLFNSGDDVKENVFVSFGEVQFMYNLKLSGKEAAALLRKVANFIEEDEGQFAVELAVVKSHKKFE